MGCGWEGEHCREAQLEEEIIRLEAALAESRQAMALLVKEMGKAMKERRRQHAG